MGEPEITRRTFLKSTGVSIAPLVFRQARPAGPLQAETAPSERGLSPEWLRSLADTKPIVYRGAALEHAAMPLGGIGTGSVALQGRGDLVEWQIFNNIDKSARVPDSCFAVRVTGPGRAPELRRLTEGPRDEMPGFAEAELRATYPIARLTLRDPSLPIACDVEAWNPMIPLDSKRSTMPVANYHLRATNPGTAPVDVTFVASVRNVIGWDGHGAIASGRLAAFRGNRNRVVREDGLTAIEMTSVPFSPAKLEKPVRVYVLGSALDWGRDEKPENLTAEMDGGRLPQADELRAKFDLVWMNGSMRWPLEPEELDALADYVGGGGTVLFSGALNPLVVASHMGPDRRMTLDDFESGAYSAWTAEGNAFGTEPASGAVNWQSPVKGFQGRRFANSFQPDDGSTGVLRSKPFDIRDRWLQFRVGGGAIPGQTCLNLVVDGRVVLSATGNNSEALEPRTWDLSEWQGKSGRLEIVDRATGAWGHVLVDDIRLSSRPDFIPQITHEERETLRRILIGQDSRVRIHPTEILAPGSALSREDDYRALARAAGTQYLPCSGRDGLDPRLGTLLLATPDPGSLARASEPDASRFWRDVLSGDAWKGALELEAPRGEGHIGALGVPLSVPPGETREATFVLAWRFPNREYGGSRVGNRYAAWHRSALEAGRAAIADLASLKSQTRLFHDTMLDTSLPFTIVDAVTSQASILRSPTYMWLEDGHIAAFEGCADVEGCCPMNCTHVYNYVQAVAKLYPELERGVRLLDLEHQQDPDGGIRHRIPVPILETPGGPPPAADGQCGTVLKTYREHLQSADRRFLDSVWPRTKRALDYAIRELDRDEDGVLEGPQFNTYDQDVTGPNTFVGSLYLAALRAGEEMARLEGEEETAAGYRRLFEKGSAFCGQRLWNGEYFFQLNGPEYGTGCLADQLLGQWWAHLLDLGYVLPRERVRTALRSIFNYNFLPSHENVRHLQRVFADGTDKGLLNCSWPKGGRPKRPILYCDEVWTGVEYQVASHMLYEGIVEEALAIVKGARDRYDGKKRNPWNEIECGDHYARAMSSFALLAAAQGLLYDGPAGILGFAPRLTPERHKSFFVAAESWGSFEQSRSDVELNARISVKWGALALRELRLQAPFVAREARVDGPWGRSTASTERLENWTRVLLSGNRRVEACKSIGVTLVA